MIRTPSTPPASDRSTEEPTSVNDDHEIGHAHLGSAIQPPEPPTTSGDASTTGQPVITHGPDTRNYCQIKDLLPKVPETQRKSVALTLSTLQESQQLELPAPSMGLNLVKAFQTAMTMDPSDGRAAFETLFASGALDLKQDQALCERLLEAAFTSTACAFKGVPMLAAHGVDPCAIRDDTGKSFAERVVDRCASGESPIRELNYLNLAGEFDRSPLYRAAFATRDLDVLKLLARWLHLELDEPLKPPSRHANLTAFVESGEALDHQGAVVERPVLFSAVSPKQVEFLVRCGADVNVKDAYRTTPLMRADVEMARTMLQLGADPKARDYEQRTALWFVKTVDHAELLVQHGARVDDSPRGGIGQFHAWERPDMTAWLQARLEVEQTGGA